ncbi:DUF1329 domain-containing protein [Pseudomonas sp. H9]|uniref:DUF1329 domain-containing protein n=1 Tax=Pseudomonas sp. H9 TaxID=483968 RepID=UPI001057E8CF|nr:DUF1329 domain-containing protein [Pseudomonas sp. H9]TDF80766.1 DUF1329 domain-containing protein [Pseudomonas sp. H9]
MKNALIRTSALALSLLATGVMAAVSPQEAAQLGTTLTPLGAEKAGNADGSIPAWTGGLKPGAAPVDSNGFLGNPFKDEKPLFVITAATVEQYKAKLSAGQLAMFKRYPDTYRIPVYQSHRTAWAPQAIYDAARKSAVTTESQNGGNDLKNFDQSRVYAFPIPKNGVEVVWNHMTRYRGTNYTRNHVQVVPQVNGAFTPVEMQDNAGFPQYMPDADPQQTSNILFYYKQAVTAPSRLAGSVTLVHETVDQIKEPRMAWSYNAGQRRVRRAPQVAYDGPGTAADGMRTADNGDMYNGAPDRYEWKLIGKKEMYIPYNEYQLQSPSLKYTDIIKPGHINPDYTRYELHRVWEVEATLRPGQRHIYAKRHMYFDEDTWALMGVDHYDSRGQLWRVAEGHNYNDFEHGINTWSAMAIYDLIAGRYLAMNLVNEARHAIAYDQPLTQNDFTPAALRNAGVR